MAFLFNEITRIRFAASFIRHHRPSLCSWPTAAINLSPLLVNAKLFTKPLTGTSNNNVMVRKWSPNFHSFMNPSEEPTTTEAECLHCDWNWMIECVKIARKILSHTWCNHICIEHCGNGTDPIGLTIFSLTVCQFFDTQRFLFHSTPNTKWSDERDGLGKMERGSSKHELRHTHIPIVTGWQKMFLID